MESSGTRPPTRAADFVRADRLGRFQALIGGVAMLAIVSAGCGSGDSDPPTADTVAPDAQPGGSPANCVIRLHGKGGTGSETSVSSGIIQVSPTGNADGWGARQWIYFPDDAYVEAREIVTAAATATACDRFVLNGFSNGAAFAGKLYCRGETFDGRLVGVVIDDPVPDHGATDCSSSPDVAGALYWTGGLAQQARPGADCAAIDWTCDGGTAVGIEAYAAALGLAIQPSPFTEHEWYVDAPEIGDWLGD